MKFIADFHIHSPYSRATSKHLVPENIYKHALIKGVQVIGSGDFTHPKWIEELKEKLEPAEPGLFKLKKEYIPEEVDVHNTDKNIRLFLSAEISNIYKKNGKVRKVHSVILAPDFETVEKINSRLISLNANLKSDGRPIIGMDTKDLLSLCLDASEDIFFIPAHIWTPWFSLLGSKSGFDSVEECFEDLSGHIHALETGLSSDVPMNRICSILDKYALVSNSDAHSPEKLGRNANIFNTDMDYFSIVKALKDNNGKTFEGTIDLFPQEGKYHFDGHRKCDICFNPLDTIEHRGICPVCNKPLVVGVLNRVAQLSDRKSFNSDKFKSKFNYIIPLKEILSEIHSVGESSKKITGIYNNLIKTFGNELDILLNIPLEDLTNGGEPILARAIERMRNRDIIIEEGYDGVYGRIKLFTEDEKSDIKLQDSLFSDEGESIRESKKIEAGIPFDLEKFQSLKSQYVDISKEDEISDTSDEANSHLLDELNDIQRKAAEHAPGPSIILAGPGTGKTKTLTLKIANLILNNSVAPENILAVTFTNKAAGEMKERIVNIIDNKKVSSRISIHTFHSLGYEILKKHGGFFSRDKDFFILDESEKNFILKTHCNVNNKDIKKISGKITEIKQNIIEEENIKDKEIQAIFKRYESHLAENNFFDLDDLIYKTYLLLFKNSDILTFFKNRFQWILVDEYQDVNQAQYRLITLLMPDAGSNLCVIGDPNQSIYGFRGADVSFINSFIDDYPASAIFKLNQTYRCSETIVKASGNVLSSSVENNIQSSPFNGVSLKIVEENTDKSEAEFIARQIEVLTGGVGFFSFDSDVTDGFTGDDHLGFSDIAILCRTKSLFTAVEKALKDHSIPYQVAGNDDYFSTDPVKTIISIFEIFTNENSKNLQLTDYKEFYTREVELYLQQNVEKKTIMQLIKNLLEIISHRFKNNNESHIKRFLEFSKGYKKNISLFLKDIKIGNDVDLYNEKLENVRLLTMHASKGLEFEAVFVPACEEKIIPYNLFKELQTDINEENRLLYVAMTRAKKYLYMSHAKKRFLNGREYNLAKSSFLQRIEKKYTEFLKNKFKDMKAEKEDDQLSLF